MSIVIKTNLFKIRKTFIYTTLLSVFFGLILFAFLFTSPTNAQNEGFITELDVNSINNPSFITTDIDGNIWAILDSKIGRITPNGTLTEFSLPPGFSSLQRITSGPDGNIWFTAYVGNKIGKLTPDGTVTEYPLPQDSYPIGITAGPDGNVWFVEYIGSNIGRITPDGNITEFHVSYGPHDITTGPDGNLWFTVFGSNMIGRITPNGAITEFKLPPSTLRSNPESITSGPDGNIWFTETGGNEIGKITPNGIITEYAIPTPDSFPYDITAGADGNLWFTETQGKKIGRITPNGSINEFQIPTANSVPRGITRGSDDTVWFANSSAKKLGRIDLSRIPVLTPIPTATIAPTSTPTPTPPSNGGILNVPYFSQNSEPWGSKEYDHTNSLGITGYNASMDRWGCAVTSVAMILNYHSMNNMVDGTSITPESVNNWLKNNNGYSYGYGKTGWYSAIKWWEVGKLTAELYKAGKAPYKLEWKKSYKSSQTDDLLHQDLTTGNNLAKIPSILLVTNKDTDGHYVVAKGKVNNTYAINDPEWNYHDLTSFNSTYSDAHRYVPSKTDLSYLTAIVNPNVEILVTDSQGRRTGRIIESGSMQEFNEIPNASYNYSPPISNPSEDGSQDKLGTGVNEFLLPTPEEGDYTITISSLDNSIYTLNTSILEVDGDSLDKKNFGTVSPDAVNTFAVTYSQTEPAVETKEITFDVLKSDINSLYTQGQIKNKIVYNTLKLQALLADRAIQMNRQPLGSKLAILALKTFQFELNKVRGKSITEDAYQILYQDAKALIENLQGGSGGSSPTPTPQSGGS